MSYLFSSERLGFRSWKESDDVKLYKISSDPEVMKYFPQTETLEQTRDGRKKMQEIFDKKGYCYFIVELLETSEVIGFIGVYDQVYESDFTPAIDIGWRIAKKHWNKGYATEGAKRCLKYVFETLKLKRLIAVATHNNQSSINVMKKIGMTKIGEFNHPYIAANLNLNPCVCFEVKNLNQSIL